MKLIDPWNSPYKSKQGNIGLGKSISIFSEAGITVLLPLNDTQDYDLVIDFNGLKRISVKTTKHTDHGKYTVLLKRSGGSSKTRKVTLFNNKNSDYLFCYTKKDDGYLIPTKIITVKNSLTLTEKLDCYKIYSGGKINLSALEEILNVEAP